MRRAMEDDTTDQSSYHCSETEDSNFDETNGNEVTSDTSSSGLDSDGLESGAEPVIGNGKDDDSIQTNKYCSGKSANSDRENSDGENPSKCCPICLVHFKQGKPVAIPDGGCSHAFCIDCLREWSKNVATCPIDRHEFRNIIIKSSINGKEIKRERVRHRILEGDEEEEVEENDGELWTCEYCGSGEREEVLLLCDGCNLAYHYDTCLTPPLRSVPSGRWYCPTCSLAGLGSNTRRNKRAEVTLDSASDVEIYENFGSELRRRRRAVILSDSEHSDNAAPSHCRNPMALQNNQTQEIVPRTMQTERVRRVVARRRGTETLPKKPLSAYFLFLQDERPRAKDDLMRNNEPFGMTDVAKEVARRWSELQETTKAEYQRRYRIAKSEYDRVVETMPKATVRPRKTKTVKGKKKRVRRTAANKRKTTAKLRGNKGNKRRATTKSKKRKSTRKYSRKKCRKKVTNSSTRGISKASYSRCSDAEVDGGDKTVGKLSLFGHKDDLDYFEGK